MKIKLRSLDEKNFNNLQEFYLEEEHARIDALTPKYKAILDSLSPSQRKLVVSLVRYGKPARICELAEISRIWQQNKTSSYVSRLVKEGFLEKQKDGRYYLNSRYPDLEKYLMFRVGILPAEN